MKTNIKFNFIGIDNVRKWWNKRNAGKRWPTSDQIRWLRTHAIDDRQWLSHDPVAFAILNRYVKMLRPDWQTVTVERISDFRDRIGLNPHKKFSTDEEDLIKMWSNAGGSFHGPNIETGTMPKDLLIPFLRQLRDSSNE